MQISSEAPRRPSKWVILIGLDFYIDHKRCLRGAINDVDDVQLFLSRNHTLISLTKLVSISHNDESQTEPDGPEASWPTYENITNELERVTKSASSGDYVYIHYSGHGTLSPTTAEEYQEDLGSDAALVLYDRKTGTRYLRGIELAALLDQMVRKGLQLTVVLDCCNSGALSRGDQLIVRGMPWDSKIASAYPLTHKPLPPTLTETVGRDRDASINQHWLLHPRGYTLLGACGPDEIAAECSGRDGRPHGALTYFLFKTLSSISRSDLGITLGAVYRRVCAELRISLSQQHPVFLGSETSIFLSQENMDNLPRSGCNIIDVLEDNRITLDVGYAQMVGLGDEYIINAFASGKRQNTESSAVCRIKTVHALQSEAELLRSPSNGAVISKGWHAVLSKPFRAKAQVSLSMNRNQTLEQMVTQSPWLELVNHCEVSSSLPSFDVEITDQEKSSIYINGNDKVQHLPPDTIHGQNGAKRIVIILEHLAKFATIEGLGNDILSPLVPLESHLSSEARSLRPYLDSEFSIDFGSKDCAHRQMRGNVFPARDGEGISINFKNHTRQSLFLAVFNMTPLRKVSKIYPSFDRGDYKEVPPKSARFRGETAFTMRMSVPSRLKTELPTEVVDIIKFFITSRPVLALRDALELPELSEEGLAKPRDQSSDQTLLDFVNGSHAFHGPNGTFRTERDRWTCLNFVIRTESARIYGADKLRYSHN